MYMGFCPHTPNTHTHMARCIYTHIMVTSAGQHISQQQHTVRAARAWYADASACIVAVLTMYSSMSSSIIAAASPSGDACVLYAGAMCYTGRTAHYTAHAVTAARSSTAARHSDMRSVLHDTAARVYTRAHHYYYSASASSNSVRYY